MDTKWIRSYSQLQLCRLARRFSGELFLRPTGGQGRIDQFDIQGSYRIYRKLQWVVSGLNLSNEVFGFYTGSPIYPNQREYYKPTVIFGVRWSSAVD